MLVPRNLTGRLLFSRNDAALESNVHHDIISFLFVVKQDVVK